MRRRRAWGARCSQVWRAVGRSPREAADALMAAGPPAANQRTLKSAFKLMRPLLASLTDCQPGTAPAMPLLISVPPCAV